MKTLFKNIQLILLLGISLFVANSCDNPLIDKETGEDIPLLIVDPNVFDTKIAVHLMDMEGNYVTGTDISTTFLGTGAGQIVTFGGEHDTLFTTANGIFEVAVDPAFEISESNPLTLYLFANADDYSYVAYPRKVQLVQEGFTDVILTMFPAETEKSALVLNDEPEPVDFTNEEPFNIYIRTNASLYRKIHYPKNHREYYANVFKGMYLYSEYVWKNGVDPFSVNVFCSNLSLPPIQVASWGAIKPGELLLKTSADYQSQIGHDNKEYVQVCFGYKKANMKTCTSGLNISLNYGSAIPSTQKLPYVLEALVNGEYQQVANGFVSGRGNPMEYNTGSFDYPEHATEFRLSVNTGTSAVSAIDIEPAITNISTAEICGKTVELNASHVADNSIGTYKFYIQSHKTDENIVAAFTGFASFKEVGSSKLEFFTLWFGTASIDLKNNTDYEISLFGGDQYYPFDFSTNRSKTAEMAKNAVEKYSSLDKLEIKFKDKVDDSDSPTQVNVDGYYKGKWSWK